MLVLLCIVKSRCMKVMIQMWIKIQNVWWYYVIGAYSPGPGIVCLKWVILVNYPIPYCIICAILSFMTTNELSAIRSPPFQFIMTVILFKFSQFIIKLNIYDVCT